MKTINNSQNRTAWESRLSGLRLGRRFARRLFSMLLVINLIFNSVGIVSDELVALRQAGVVRRAAAEGGLELELDDQAIGIDASSENIQIDDVLLDGYGDLPEDIGDLHLTTDIVSNADDDANTYTWVLNGETRLLLSDLVKQLQLPIKKMKYVEMVSLLGNEQDPTIDMSLFITIVEAEDDFIIFLKPLFAEAKLSVYTAKDMYTIKLVNDPEMDVLSVAKAAAELAKDPATFETVFRYDFGHEPANIRLSQLLKQVGLTLKAKSIVDVGVVEHHGDEGQYVAIDKVKGDYAISASRRFDRIELAVCTAQDIHRIALLNGEAVERPEAAVDESADKPSKKKADQDAPRSEVPSGEADAARIPAVEVEAEPEEIPAVEAGAEPEEIPAAAPEAEPEEIPAAAPEAEPEEVPAAAPEAEPEEIPAAEPEAEPEEIPVVAPEAEPEEIPAVALEADAEDLSAGELGIELIPQTPEELEIPQLDLPAEELGIGGIEVPPEALEPEIAEAELEAEPTIAPEAEPEMPGPEPEAEPTIAPEAEPEMPGPEPEAEPTIAPEAEPEMPGLEPGAEPTIAPEAKPETPELEPEAEPTIAPEAEPETPELEPETEPTIAPEAKPETPAAEPEAEAGVEPEVESEIGLAGPEPDPALVPEGEVASGIEAPLDEAGMEQLELPDTGAEVELPEIEPEADPDTASEADNTDEPTVVYPAARFEARASGVTVSVTAEEGAFPEGTTMAVRRVWDSDTLSEIRETVADDFVKVRRVQAVDIAFYDADGNEIEPRIPVAVVISVSEIADDQSALVVHVDDDGSAQVVTEAEADSGAGRTSLNVELPAGETEPGEVAIEQTEVALGDGGMDIGFDADAFSLYAVVVTETISTHYIDASGNTYAVEVSYGPEAGIPSGAQLEVSELTGGAADAYTARAAEALNVNDSQVTYAKALDISIYADGQRVQPAVPVSVSIRLLDAPDASDGINIDVIHFGDTPEQLSCALDADAVAFEADGFSVYVVAYTVDFHWGEYTWSIAGDGEILLSELLEKLGVTEIALSDVTDASSSNFELVSVEALDSDWRLTSMKPFRTEETLTLTLRNGERVEIAVTDADGIVAPTAVEGLVYTGAAQALIVSEGALVYSLSEDGVFSETIPTGTDAGNYTVYYRPQDGGEAQSVSVTIARAPVTVTADDGSKAYGTADPGLTATVNGLIGQDSISYVLSRDGGENAGTYPITVSGDGEQGNYAVTWVPGVFTISPRPIAIVADSSEKPYDRSPLTNDSFYIRTGDLAQGDLIDRVVVTGSQTEVGTGANIPGDARIVNVAGEDVTRNYDISYENGTLEVKPKNVFVTANNATKQYGKADELTARVTGLLSGDAESLIAYTVARAGGENVGSYTITPSGEALQGYYNVIYRTGTLTITPARVTVTANDQQKVAGEDEPTYTAAVTGLQNGDDESVITCTLSRPDNTADNPDREKSGAHAIVAAGEEAQGNYTVEFVNGVLTIEKLTITFRDGGDAVRVCALELNQPIGEVDDLAGVQKPDCDFKGWYMEDGTRKVTSETAFQAVTDLFAHFTVTVSFEADGVDNPPAVVLDEGDELGALLPVVSKDGCRFDGWYSNPEFEGDKVADTDTFEVHTTLYAKFVELATVGFEVATVEAEGTTTAPIEGTRQIDRGASLGTNDYPELEVPDGYAFKGWFIGDTRIDAGDVDYPIDADMTVTAKLVKQTTVTYYAEQGDDTAFHTDTGDVNRVVSFPDPGPVRDGAAFKGWFDGEARVSDDFVADSDRTLTGRYTVTVDFVVKSADYTTVTSETPVVIDKDTAIGDQLLNEPLLTGYRFKGWFIADADGKPGATQVTADSPVFSAHTTVVAKFARQVTVIFDTEGTRHEYTVDAGDAVQLLENPIKENARFDGWFDGNGRRVSNAEGVVDDTGNLVTDGEGNPIRVLIATEDMTLTARFIDQITVEFIVVHPQTTSGSTGYPSLNSEGKFTIDKTDEGSAVPSGFYDHIPSVSGYYFLGWYPVKRVSDDSTDYDPSYGSSRFVIPNSTVDGKVYELDEDNPAYIRDKTTELPLFTDDTILVAKFIREVTITFRYDDQSWTSEDRYLVGKPLSDYYLPLEQPSNDPSAYKEGYRIEWLRDGNKVDPDYEIQESDDNAVFDARYIRQVTATFLDENGNEINDTDGNAIRPVTRDVNTALGALPEVVQTVGSGDQQRWFMGWFDDAGKQYTAETVLTADVTLKAKYGHQVTYNVDGDDTWSFVRLVEPGAALSWLPDAPFREGCSFRNWTLDDVEVTADHVVTRNETIIGHYDDVSIYEITVNYNIADVTEDAKILTVDRDSVTEESPTTVTSPSSFKKSDANYYPVMQAIQLVPDSDTGIGVKDRHADVTVQVDPDDAKKITVTVPYKKSDATYTVRYMLRNLNGNGYTQIESATLAGVIGASVSPDVREYDYADFESAETGKVVNATGDVFNVYYTRKYFTLTYDTKGGKAIDSVTALYGTSVTLPTAASTPKAERDGYTFDGWYRNPEYTGTRVTGSLALNEDTTLYAKWNPKTVNYTIVYMLEKYDNATGTTTFEYDSSRTGSGQVGTVVSASSAPNISGTRNGYEKDTTQNATSQIIITADGSAVLQVYYKLIRYTLVFNINRNTGRITIGGQTYSGSNYRIEDVVLGQDISAYWPSTASEIYDTATGNQRRYFQYWSGAAEGNYVTKRSELIWGNVSNANSSHIMTYTGNWVNSSANRNAEYWLQQPDGSYKVEDAFTQIGLNTTNLGAKDIDGYTKHNGDASAPTGYPGSGYTEVTGQTWVDAHEEEREDTTDHGSTWEDGGYIWTFVRSYSTGGWWSTTYYVYKTTIPGHYVPVTGYSSTYTYRFYYDRMQYSIDYYYGTENIETKSGILFGADISSGTYNFEPNRQSAGVESDYIWDGWFTDSGCTTPFAFTTMPGHNVVLYTKWHAPSYTVTFHLNYDGAAPEPYFQREVEKYKTVTAGLSQDDQNALNNPSPAPAHHSFLDWFTDPTNGVIFDPSGKTITADTDVYAHWKPNGVSYTVHYYRAGTTQSLLPSKTVAGNLVVGQEITEYAPYVTGYLLDDEETTMVADAGSKTIILDYEDNVIIFYYGKKPDSINYTVRYVLYTDKDKPADQQMQVAPSVTKSVSGSYTSVTETAAAPTLAGYEDYRPTRVTDMLALGTDSAQNVLTFYYTKGAHVTVEWLDMEGDSARASVDTYLDVGQTYTLDTAINGYTLDHVEKNGATTDERSFTAVSNTEEIGVRAYYRRNLTILAHSANKPYDGTPLVLESVPGSVTADGLKDGHTLTGITISGSQTDVGVSDCTPSEAVVSGLKNGLTAEQFYDITYLSGALTVTKINVVISVEPDRWTGNVYDGNYKATGFTNGSKTIADYVIINNTAYRDAYLEAIWENLKAQLLNNGRGYVEVPDALSDGSGQRTVTGLRILYQRNAGDYYEESGVFLAATTAAVAALPEAAKANYNLILYAREARLEIGRAPLRIETEGAAKPYDGTPLTDEDLTVKVNGAAIAPEGQSYTLAEGDTVTIKTTGRQTHPGTSQNIYEIDWGEVDQENYNLSEALGTLEVTSRPLLIEAQDLYKAFGAADPAFAVKVYPARYVKKVDENGDPMVDGNGDPVYNTVVDASGNTVLDADGNPVLQVERAGAEIPSTLTRWGGDNYTLQLNDSARGYIDNLSIKITREAGDTPGTYVITPAWADDAVQNYNATYVNGRLTIGIARVSNDNGATWTYHQWLENDSGFYPESSYNAGTDDPSEQGAFDKARELGGDVIVETLCDNGDFAKYDIPDRYTLGKQVTLTDDALASLTLRTTAGAEFTSVISRGYDGDSLFANQCAFTLENITLDGGRGAFTGDSDGGLVHVRQGGALKLNKGATLRNSATSARGGAVFADGPLTIAAGAVITGNTASNGGNAVFVGDGSSITMTGGSITGNDNTTGSAVEIDGAGASLAFSGGAVVWDNLTGGAQHNVYLDRDNAGIINANGLTTKAKIGVYVEDTAVDTGAEAGKLFEDRGGVLDRFGTYANGANLQTFVNDRNGLKGTARNADEIIWVQPITVEVRYMANLKDHASMPTAAANAYLMKPGKYMVLASIEYVPSLGSSALACDPAALGTTGFTVGQIEKDIYDNYGGSAWSAPATDTMVFWRAYAGNESAFDAWLVSLCSDPDGRGSNYGKWRFVNNSGSPVPTDSNKLILYYTEPAYITISNESGNALTNNDMIVMLPGYARASGDTTGYSAPDAADPAAISAFGHAFVTKIGDEVQSKPYSPATADALSLANGRAVTLMIPGAVGAMYWFSGEFSNVIPEVTVISVERTGGTAASNEKTIKLDTVRTRDYPSTARPALPLSRADASSHRLYGALTKETILRFGETYICKITDANGNLLRVDGRIQAFKTLEEAFKAYADNPLTAYTTRDGASAAPAYIKMLVEDYDLKLGKLAILGDDYAGMTQITVPANKPVILTTASTTDEELPGPYTGAAATRSVINRGICETSMFSVPGNGSFGTENIVFDGGAVFDDEGVYQSGEIGADGGVVNVAASGILTIGQGTVMRNSAVESADTKNKKGGAVYAAAGSTLSIQGTPSNRVEFRNCQANGGGAIYNPGTGGFGGTVSAEYCTFEFCQAKGRKDDGGAGQCGGGAIRCMANTLTLDHCAFKNCSAVEQGGAIYHLKDGNASTEFKAEYCTFTSCSCYDPQKAVQAAAGGAETQARRVTVDHCAFTECSSSKNAGAFNVFNTNAAIDVKNTTFTRCKTTGVGSGDYGNGGALRTTGKSTTVENCTFDSCEASNRGGAIHCKTNTTIKGSTVIEDSIAHEIGGGAVYLQDGVLTIESGTIRSCEAPDGGAIYQGGGTCNMTGGTITGCVATKKGNNNGRGGGVYMGGGTFNMKGGAINSCNAYGNGGGVCLNNANATFNLQDGTITRCDSLASGGGVYMGGGTFKFTDGEINTCSAKTGGGVYVNGSSTVTISKDGVAIRNCRAVNLTADNGGVFTPADAPASANKGGGLYQNGGTLTITKASVSGCSAYDGGGIYLDGSNTRLNIGEAGKSDGGIVTNCTASQNGGGIYQHAGTLNMYGGTSIRQNSAANGGGIYQGGGTQTIHDGSIKSNNAEVNGGGIYLGGGSFTLKSGEVGGLNADDTPNGGNTARRGGGLFVANGTADKPTEASIQGGLLGGNHATEVAGGGGIAIGGQNVRLYFQGSIQVWGNTMEPNPDIPYQTTCDVCLSEDSNEIIRTTSVGLNEESHIGVYVPDKKVDAGWLHKDLHGTTGLPFGTFENSGSGDNCLNRFINNRSGNAYQGYEYYYGVRKPEGEDENHRIYWVDYVCEITDPQGNLLFTNSKATAPALYQYLDKHGAFEALRSQPRFYNRDGSVYTGTEYHVRMLVFDYDLKWTDSVLVPDRGTIRLTMAAEDDENLPTALKRQYDRHNGIARIGRGACTGSMFSTAANSNFIIDSVTLDGGALVSGEDWSNGVNVDGALINARGNVTLNEKVLLRNSWTTGNGTIAFKGPGTLTMNSGAVIDRCRAKNGAVLYVNAGSASEADPVNVVLNTGALWQNCEAESNGLIRVHAGVVNLNSAFDNRKDDNDTGNVRGCTVNKNGGLAWVTGGTLNVNAAVKDFTAIDGGAVYVDGSTGTVNQNAVIESCAATANGGGVYVNNGTLNQNARIESCAATANGGGIFVNSNGTVNLNAPIEGCTAVTNGGGVYVNRGTLNMTTTVDPNVVPSIKNCTAVLGGAIYETGNSARVDISTGEISGNTATGAGGGALRIEGGAQARISGTARINDNKAEGEGNKYGGAVNIKQGMLTITGGTITGNMASSTNGNAYGGAIHVGDGCMLYMSDGAISGNAVSSPRSNNEGGAINVGGENARLFFSGSPLVYGNCMDEDGNQKNLVLSVGNTSVINTIDSGLTGGTIGVYVIDGSDQAIYNAHGIQNKPFGTYINETGATKGSHADVFVNDRDLALYGVKKDDNLFYWLPCVCKLTDGDGNLLYRNRSINGQNVRVAAVYPRLEGDDAGTCGLAAAQGTLYAYNSATAYRGDAIQVKMLCDYMLPSGASLTGTRDLTLTTAETRQTEAMQRNGDAYTFSTERTENTEKALITRGAAYGSMFTLSGRAATVINIILDGNKGNYSANADGGILNATAGSLNLLTGAVLRNAVTTGNGGAVSVAGGVSLTMIGATVTGNQAQSGGGVYAKGSEAGAEKNTSVTITGGEISGNVATNNGGGICLDGDAINAILDGTQIKGNTARTGGGGCAVNITMRNGVQVTGNKVSGTDIANGGGFCVTGKLTLGQEGATEETTTISGNTTTGDQSQNSNLCLNYIPSTATTVAHNSPENVELLCPFTGKLWVSNPGGIYTQFGISGDRRFLPDPADVDTASMSALVEAARIASDDASELIGRMEPGVDGSLKIIWWKRPVCKITDGSGALLYSRNGESLIPAVYSALCVPTNDHDSAPKDPGAAFSVLNNVDPDLVYANGTKYTGKDYCVKMLDDYTLRNQMVLDTGDKRIVFTTATKAETDGYPYRGSQSANPETGEVCALLSRSSGTEAGTLAANPSFMYLLGTSNVTLANLTMDGGSQAGIVVPVDGSFVNLSGQAGLIVAAGTTLQNARANSSNSWGGGAICHGAGSRGTKVVMTGGHIKNCTTTNNGGAIAASASGSSTTEILGGTIEVCSAGNNGGAIYMQGAGCELALRGGTIKGCTAKQGGGIYLGQNASMKIGATVEAARDSGDQVRRGGQLVFSGNHGTDYAANAGKTNGKDATAYSGGKARQDIFVSGLTGDPAQSITVDGAIQTWPDGASDDVKAASLGSIWLWAEPSGSDGHYRNTEQFAVFDSALVKSRTTGDKTEDIVEFPLTTAELNTLNGDEKKTSELQEVKLRDTMKAFRNALDDTTTNNDSDTYLTGSEGELASCIYWGPAIDGYTVLLRKIDGNGDALPGATFTLYLANDAGTDVMKDADGKPVALQASGEDVTATSGQGTKRDENAGKDADHAVTIKVNKGTAEAPNVEDLQVYGDGLVVFEKIPKGTYFAVETEAPKIRAAGEDEDAAGIPAWQPVEAMYKLVVDAKGWFDVYVAGVAADGTVTWPEDADHVAPKQALSMEKTEGETQATYTYDVATALNVSPLSRKVILKKVLTTAFEPLPGKTFTIYYADRQTVVKVDGKDGKKTPLKDLTSGAGGAFYIGKLPYGVYWMEEKTSNVSHYFVIRVDENGVSTSGEKTEGGVTTTTWTPTNTVSEASAESSGS